jgi:hypothetical protein
MRFPGTDGGFRVVLKRIGSIDPSGLQRVFVAIAAVSFAIGASALFVRTGCVARAHRAGRATA